MSPSGDNWQENFLRYITVECKNESCTNTVRTLAGSAAATGVYCDDCRPEARALAARNYYERKGRQRRRHRREQKRAA